MAAAAGAGEPGRLESDFPARFTTYEAARAFCHPFFIWHNTAHRHGGIGLLTPAMVHFGQADTVRARRADVLAAAYAAHPERFVRRTASGADGPARRLDQSAQTGEPRRSTPFAALGRSRRATRSL